MPEDAISYPTVNIGGQAVEVKFRVGDIIRLYKTHKINLMEKLDGITPMEGIDRVMLLLSAGVSHHQKFDPDALADLVDFADLGTVAAAIGEALGKASALVARATPTQTPQPETPVQ